MKKRILTIGALLLSVSLMTGCTSGGSQKEETKQEKTENTENTAKCTLTQVTEH